MYNLHETNIFKCEFGDHLYQKKKGHAVAFCESETACNGDYTTLKTAPKDLTLLKLTTKFSSAIVRYKKTISPFGNTPPAQNSEEGGTIDFVANSGDAGF